MNRKDGPQKKSPMTKLSALLVLVALVFGVLLVSFLLAGLTVFLLMENGLIAPLAGRNLGSILLFFLLVSLGIGTIFSAIGGTLFLRPLRRLIAATKEISAGNFDIHLQESGPYEMRRLTGSFNEMARRLGQIEALRKDFINSVSHEFKTPMVSIQGFAKLLKRSTLTEAQRDEYLDIILMESERMTKLSSNVLLLSNLNNLDALTEMADFSLDEQLREVVLLYQPQTEQKQLAVTVALESIMVHGNEEFFRQVWLHLLGNAVKFTPEGGEIRVEASASVGAATVTIADTGIGMSEEVRQHLFEKFYQGDNARATQGNGLGLALVQRILTLSNASITMQSEEGKGSAFTVTIPLTGAGERES